MKTLTINNQYTAASLYDGGWRAEDKEQLMQEFELLEEEADELVAELEKIACCKQED